MLPILIYVDGESHYTRTEHWLRDEYGSKLTFPNYAEQLRGACQRMGHRLPVFEPDCKVFWDWRGHLGYNAPTRRIVYITASTGDDDTLHKHRVGIRSQDLEPQVLKERSNLGSRREGMLTNNGIIEKAKGVDIALAVRMLEDAYRNVFNTCYLFTSDVDYLPVIEAVQRLGKLVEVCGFRSGLGKNSPLEYVPHAFVDLEKCWGENNNHLTDRLKKIGLGE